MSVVLYILLLEHGVLVPAVPGPAATKRAALQPCCFNSLIAGTAMYNERYYCGIDVSGPRAESERWRFL